MEELIDLQTRLVERVEELEEVKQNIREQKVANSNLRETNCALQLEKDTLQERNLALKSSLEKNEQNIKSGISLMLQGLFDV